MTGDQPRHPRDSGRGGQWAPAPVPDPAPGGGMSLAAITPGGLAASGAGALTPEDVETLFVMLRRAAARRPNKSVVLAGDDLDQAVALQQFRQMADDEGFEQIYWDPSEETLAAALSRLRPGAAAITDADVRMMAAATDMLGGDNDDSVATRTAIGVENAHLADSEDLQSLVMAMHRANQNNRPVVAVFSGKDGDTIHALHETRPYAPRMFETMQTR